jgi:hypothetical protein
MTKDLNYCKAILYKVSFDPSLFKKELQKAYRLLRTIGIRGLGKNFCSK